MQPALSCQLRVKSDRHQIALAHGDRMVVERSQNVYFLTAAADPGCANEDGMQRTTGYSRELHIAFERAKLTAEGVALGGDVEQPEVLAVQHDHAGAGAKHGGSAARELTQWVGKAVALDAECHHRGLPA